MRIAIVGAGISGIAAAHRLQDSAEVTVFEARRRIGGHTDTHSILVKVGPTRWTQGSSCSTSRITLNSPPG